MQTQEVVIKPNLRVVLKADAQKLDEVVVTAMGISREKKAFVLKVLSVIQAIIRPLIVFLLNR